MNPPTYPNFLRFLKLNAPKGVAPPSKSNGIVSQLRRLIPGTRSDPEPIQTDIEDAGIRVVPTEMTFSVSKDGGAFEWAGKNLLTIFCQAHRLLDSGMWAMVYDVLRFNACSRRVLTMGLEEISIGEYLVKEGYSDAFRDNYLIVSWIAFYVIMNGY